MEPTRNEWLLLRVKKSKSRWYCWETDDIHKTFLVVVAIDCRGDVERDIAGQKWHGNSKTGSPPPPSPKHHLWGG
jgi:hypothetical protein